METRDEFALAVLPAIYAEFFAGCRDSGGGPQDEHWREGLALDAYRMADAMLAMRGIPHLKTQRNNGSGSK